MIRNIGVFYTRTELKPVPSGDGGGAACAVLP
jgi:hypothetical protein